MSPQLRRTAVVVATLPALAVLAPASSGAERASGTACLLWAAAFGNDGNPGSRAQPFRTAGKLVASLGPGQTGCLEAGATFNERLVLTRGGRTTAPITLTSGSGPRAALGRPVVVQPGAINLRLFRVVLRGRAGQAEPMLSVRASGFSLLGADVDGQGSAGPCVAVDQAAAGVVLDASTIHGCGSSGAPAISVTNAWKLAITNDFVYGNGGDAISLAPNAQRTVVSHDILDSNDAGVFVGGGATTASSNSVISQNVISYSKRFAVHAAFGAGSPVGARNVVSRNCFWRAGVRALSASPGRAITARRNLSVDPRFTDRSKGFGLRPGPCFAKRPVRYFEDRHLVAGPLPVIRLPLMRSFTVKYTFSRSGGSVRLTALSIVGLQPGAGVRLSCTRGCSLTEGRRANAVGVAVSRRFLTSYGAGTVIRIQATSPGFVGRYKLLTIGSGGVDVGPNPYAYCVGSLGPKNCRLRP